jgi:hypothetical protein
MTEVSRDERTAIEAQLIAEVATRQAAERELADLGIRASLADVEAWVAMTPKERRHAAYSWSVMRMAYL